MARSSRCVRTTVVAGGNRRRRRRPIRSRRSDAQRRANEHLLHSGDLRRLIDVDVRSELERELVLSGARGAEQRLHHLDRAAVMLDHAAQKRAVEVRPARPVEGVELRRRQHARHECFVMCVARRHAGHRAHGRPGVRVSGDRVEIRLRHGLSPVGQPLLHDPNLVLLRVDDPRAERAHVVARAMGRRPARHDHRLRMVRDHPRHEGDVGRRVRPAHAVGERLSDRCGVGVHRRESRRLRARSARGTDEQNCRQSADPGPTNGWPATAGRTRTSKSVKHKLTLARCATRVKRGAAAHPSSPRRPASLRLDHAAPHHTFTARSTMAKFSNILGTVGNTPIVKINRLAPAGVTLYVKIEAFNPLGSVKPGQTVIEATSGNTGIGLAMVCAAKGYPLVVTMAESFSVERRRLMRFLGAKVVITPAAGRGIGMVEKATELANKHGWFEPHQFENEANADMHTWTTAREIVDDFKGEKLDYWVTGFGTGGTLKGEARVLAKERPDTKIVVCEPDDAPMLTSGEKQGRNADGTPAKPHPAFKPHPMQGWSPDFIPLITGEAIDKKAVDRILTVPGPE